MKTHNRQLIHRGQLVYQTLPSPTIDCPNLRRLARPVHAPWCFRWLGCALQLRTCLFQHQRSHSHCQARRATLFAKLDQHRPWLHFEWHQLTCWAISSSWCPQCQWADRACREQPRHWAEGLDSGGPASCAPVLLPRQAFALECISGPLQKISKIIII